MKTVRNAYPGFRGATVKRRGKPFTLGAKTAYLDAFKRLVERTVLMANISDRLGMNQYRTSISIPQRIAIPIEFFERALIEAGVLDKDLKFVKLVDPEELQFNKKELEILKQIFEYSKIEDGWPYAIRSDERTAKGVGVFSTDFHFDNEYNFEHQLHNSFPIFLEKIKRIILTQFSPLARAFKERAGMEHGIGIQIMPLVAEFGFLASSPSMEMAFAPKISIAGVTHKESKSFMLHIGLGVGGGVGQRAYRFAVPFNFDFSRKVVKKILGKGYSKQVTFHDAECFVRGSHMMFHPSKNSTELYGDSFYFFDHKILGIKLNLLMHLLRKIAKKSNTDLYFEIQSFDLSEDQNSWAFTQIAPHVWPKVEGVEKGELAYNFSSPEFAGEIVGTGLVDCNCVVDLYEDPHEINPNSDKPLFIVSPEIRLLNQRDDPSGLSSTAEYSHHIEMFRRASAVFTSYGHQTVLSSHNMGIFRELGIPVINASVQDIEVVRRLVAGRNFKFFADELKNKGGIIIP